ncbi:MAG: tetratricopeptide repeat protein [Saprospiraceae bacterium]|nr:tetratricopeptide repeat protein [Saprospiraceae bacterium]
MEELYNRIEDYLDDTLSPADRAAFEAELAADAELAAALEVVREARERLSRQWAGEAADTALHATLRQVGAQHFGASEPAATQTNRPWIVRRWPALAAAAAIAGLLIWLGWPAGNTDARLYAQYKTYPKAGFVTRGGGPDQAELANATAAFNQGRYQDALPVLEQQAAAYPDDLEARFFLALCLIETGRTADGRAQLEQISAAPNAWASDARWQLALSYLKEKDRSRCQELLSGIPPDDAHYEQAQQLLAKLR